MEDYPINIIIPSEQFSSTIKKLINSDDNPKIGLDGRKYHIRELKIDIRITILIKYTIDSESFGIFLQPDKLITDITGRKCRVIVYVLSDKSQKYNLYKTSTYVFPKQESDFGFPYCIDKCVIDKYEGFKILITVE